MKNFVFKGMAGLLLSTLLITVSCAWEGDSDSISKNKQVNEWIKDYMDVVYLWNTKMPANTKNTLSPDKYFESLLYKTEDRFSYIAADYAELSDALNGVQMEAGYAFKLFLKEKDSQDVVGLVDYIKPHSPASSTDLKRGDVFFTVNGKQLTVNNYSTLLSEMSAQHTLGVYRGGSLQSISLAVTRYEENPVLLDSIYTLGGKKIAYLIFNFFAEDKGDNSYTYLKELNGIFGKYKQANVNELILDLRYNGGGAVTVATALASMISNRTSSDLFSIDQYNSIVDRELKSQYGDNYNKTFFDDFLMIRNVNGEIINQSTPINKLSGLNRLYVLASGHTASASELIVNGLKPYMDVVLIGEKTYGKNVGMWFIYEEDPQKQKNNRWGMLPIVVKTYNSNNQSDYSFGFEPDVAVDEYDTPSLLPLGDTHELLLEAALSRIGVQQTIGLRSNEKVVYSRPIISSIDQTPVRSNLIIPTLK